MTIEQPTSDFFTAGGTLPPDAPSYVKRPTDDELYRHIMAGEFCYVLTPRQMGKSSLMIRTAQRLSNAGVKSAVVDLTQIGTVDNEDQWYKGILTQIKRRLRLKVDPVAWWEQRKDIPNIQKFIEFFEEMLSEAKEHVVIFMDEIDTTLKLDFRDDFFAGIRAMFNARAENPDLKRITFVLLGVASPSDLIKDRNRTPFNIGQEIPLKHFSREDVGMLEKGLEEAYPEYGRKILDRIFYWTNGHPYLTQKLCQSTVETRLKEYSNDEIDLLVKNLFTSEEASRETNLQFVRDNVLSYPERRVILSLYKKLLRGFEVPDNKNSLPQNHLKLSGLARIEDGKLVVSNKIYSEVFDHKWVQRYTDVDWRYPIIGVLSLVILGFSLVFYNDGIRLPNRAATMVNGVPIYYQDERGIQYLAELFRMRPYIFPNEYEYKAKDIFYNSFNTREEQRVLIEVTSYDKTRPSVEDYEIVIVGLYTSLADVDNSGETTKLLEVMHSSLNEMGMQYDPIYLEIGYWVDARNSASANNLADALAKYKSAIDLNSKNPATLFERARIYAQLGEYENSLKDYEQVIAIMPESNIEPTEGAALITQTTSFTFTPSLSELPTITRTEKSAVQTTTLPLFTKTVLNQNTLALTPTFISLPTLTKPGSDNTIPANTSIPPTTTKPPTPIETSMPTQTATPDSRPIQPRFLTRGQRIAAVKNDINQNENLGSVLSQAKPDQYRSLREWVSVVNITGTPTNRSNPLAWLFPVAPINTPAITPTCVSPIPEANPYTSHEITAGVQKIYQKSTTDLGNARQEALFQLGQNMAHWSDHVDIVNDNSHMVRITVTYLDPVLVQYIVLNYFINQPDYLASLATPMHEVTFNFELSNTLQNLGKRDEMLFMITITSPFYRRQVYNSTDLILQFPIEKLRLSGASNMQVEPIHFDRVLAQDMDITQGPVAGIVGFPLALEIDDLCNVVIDQWTNTLTLDVSPVTLGGIEYEKKFWSIPYRSLVSDIHPTPTSNPYILNNQITKLNEPPTPSWTPSPGYDDAVSQVYWENMGQYIWDLVITESNH